MCVGRFEKPPGRLPVLNNSTLFVFTPCFSPSTRHGGAIPCCLFVNVPLPQMESLFGSLPEMLDFQRVFLQTLEERIASSPDCSTLETPAQFKVPFSFFFF